MCVCWNRYFWRDGKHVPWQKTNLPSVRFRILNNNAYTFLSIERCCREEENSKKFKLNNISITIVWNFMHTTTLLFCSVFGTSNVHRCMLRAAVWQQSSVAPQNNILHTWRIRFSFSSPSRVHYKRRANRKHVIGLTTRYTCMQQQRAWRKDTNNNNTKYESRKCSGEIINKTTREDIHHSCKKNKGNSAEFVLYRGVRQLFDAMSTSAARSLLLY